MRHGPPFLLTNLCFLLLVAILTLFSLPFKGMAEQEIPDNPQFMERVASEDVVLDPARNIWVRLYSPNIQPGEKLPLIIYFHGGGFVSDSPATDALDTLCRNMSRKLGAFVVSANYRLAPQYKLPAAYEDGYFVLDWLNDDPAVVGNLDLSRVFIMGDSAGANIVHDVTLRAARDVKMRSFKLAGQILVQPFFGAVARTESEVRLATGGELTLEQCDLFWSLALPEGADRDHPFCNVNLYLPRVLEQVKQDGVQYVAEILVVIGDMDLLSDRQAQYAKILREFGMNVKVVVLRGAEHGFYSEPSSENTHRLVDEVIAFCATLLMHHPWKIR